MAAKLLPSPRQGHLTYDTSEDESENSESGCNISDDDSLFCSNLVLNPDEYAVISLEDDISLNEEEIIIEGDPYELECLHQNIQAEIRRHPQNDESQTRQSYNITKLHRREANVENELEEILEQLEAEDKKTSCSHCTEKKPVKETSSLAKGQHISIAGRKSTSYIKPLKKQIKLYSHHAVVKQVVSRTTNKVKLKLIHFFETDADGKRILSETEEVFDLQYDELYIIKYDKPRYYPDEIVHRAESALEEGAEVNKTYGILMNNCEHFATWCVVGTSESFQVAGLQTKLLNVLKVLCGSGSKISNYILRLRIMRFLYLASDDIATGISNAAGHITLGVTFGAYLLYCIVMTGYYIHRYRKKEVCWTCLKRQLLDLWLQFGVFGVTSAITYIFIHFALPLIPTGVGIPVLVLLLILSAVLMWLVPKIRKKFQSPLQAEGKAISKISELQRGDVVSFSYYKLKHYLVVTEVDPDPDSHTQGVIHCVHYSLPNLTGTRIIAEESFVIDLKNKPIKKYDCGPLNLFPANEIVRRIRTRIGETKWNMASNRSDHLCHWAVTDQSDAESDDRLETNQDVGYSQSRVLSSSFLEKRTVHLMEELQLGDIVEFGGNKGILVGLTDLRGGRSFELEMVLKKDLIRLDKETVDLNTDTLIVHLYRPAHCYPMQERIDRALAMRDKPSSCWTQSGFLEECILIPRTYRKKLVHDLSQLEGGEMVIFSYYGIPHYFIVTEVQMENEIVRTKGQLRCVHYSTSTVFSSRTVTEDWHKIDLEKDKLTLVECGHMPTFSKQEVKKRVRRRINETKWNQANRSDHLCFWAVLDQRRAEEEENNPEQPVGNHERPTSLHALETREVHLKEEIFLGDVVYLHGKSSIRDKGILVELKDIREGREFDMSIMVLKDRPRLVCVPVDLNKDKVFVKLYKPSDCYRMDERVRRANDMRDKPSQWRWQSDFIKYCVMKRD